MHLVLGPGEDLCSNVHIHEFAQASLTVVLLFLLCWAHIHLRGIPCACQAGLPVRLCLSILCSVLAQIFRDQPQLVQLSTEYVTTTLLASFRVGLMLLVPAMGCELTCPAFHAWCIFVLLALPAFFAWCSWLPTSWTMVSTHLVDFTVFDAWMLSCLDAWMLECLFSELQTQGCHNFRSESKLFPLPQLYAAHAFWPLPTLYAVIKLRQCPPSSRPPSKHHAHKDTQAALARGPPSP